MTHLATNNINKDENEIIEHALKLTYKFGTRNQVAVIINFLRIKGIKRIGIYVENNSITKTHYNTSSNNVDEVHALDYQDASS